MRILLVDDEPLARKRLLGLLATEPGVEVLGECGNATDAREAVGRLQPDLVLLDVRMPGEDGLSLARWFEAEGRPLVILVTAHAEFAVDAFEARSLDYLLKPVRPERLRQALQRARERLEIRRAPGGGDRSPGLIRRLSIKTGTQVIFLEPAQVEWIEAAGNYMVVHSAGQNHVLRETLTALERGLSPRQFIRLNRSMIVNVDAIRIAHKTGNGDYTVELRDGKRVNVTCGFRELEQRLKFNG